MNDVVARNEQKFAVKVNRGSGVLIRGATDDYAYVLTARHCLFKDKDNPEEGYIEPIVVKHYNESIISVHEKFEHQTKDLAVLVVELELAEDLVINTAQLATGDKCRFSGYPGDRSNIDNGYASHIFKYHEQVNGRLHFTPDDTTLTPDNIDGFSGGGFYKLANYEQQLMLCAIETKLVGNIDNEIHSMVSAIPIVDFVEFISKQSYQGEPLAPLLPLHLSSFEHVKDGIFDVSNSWIDFDALTFLQNNLKQIAQDQVINVHLSPLELLDEFERLLKVQERPDYELNAKALWVAMLELLIISILIDEPPLVDKQYVAQILRKRRLVYLDVEDTWLAYIGEIVFTGLVEPQDNCILVAQTLHNSAIHQYPKEKLNKLWGSSRIDKAGRDPNSIKQANQKIANIHSVVDFGALHAECIANKEDEYEPFLDQSSFDDDNEQALKQAIAQQYAPFLTVAGEDDAN